MFKTFNNKTILTLFLFLALSACQFATQTRYGYKEVGQVQVVKFGTVVAVRDIDIIADNSGSGALGGAVTGGTVGANAASGSGAVAGAVVGAVIGGNIGSALEQLVRNRGGVEYTVTLENGKTITVAQNISEKDVFHEAGDRVMVQINGEYQRVLPANTLPTEIDRPKGIKFKDE
jgi:outer membrane lipoprotein SlyB